MKNETLYLTGNEWLVMEALWQQPRTLMELVRLLGQDPPAWAKSTTSTMVRRMEAKGLVRYEEEGKAKRFYPALSRSEAALAETHTLLDKAFSGSVGLLVSTLVQQEALSRTEIDELYEILRQAEEKEGE